MSLKALSTVIAITVILQNVPRGVHAGIDDIINKCADGSCQLDSRDFNNEKYQESLYTFFTAGFGQMIWDSLRESLNNQSSSSLPISLVCKQSLEQTLQGIDEGNVNSFRMIASSGRSPDTVLQRTMTTLGDYDGCLEIGAKYCLADIFPVRFDLEFQRMHPEVMRLEELTIFQNFSFAAGLCLPSSCGDKDVRIILEKTLTPKYFRPNGFLDCDTRESISWYTRLTSLNVHQFVSLVFLLTLLSILGVTTALHLLVVAPKLIDASSLGEVIDILDNTQTNTWIDSFSLIKNTLRLLFVKVAKPGDAPRFLYVDAYKLVMVLFGSMGHAFVCLEIPNSYFMLENHQFLQTMFSSSPLQMLFNDNGLVVFGHLGGFATFYTLYPIMTKLMKDNKKFPYLLAVFDRYMRFIPSIMTMIAMEFVWTMLYSGPLFTRVSNFVLAKCTKSWWWQLTFMQNMFPGLEICAGHTFFSGVDMQLFLIGLLVMAVMVRSQVKGTLLCFVFAVISTIRVLYVAYANNTYGTLYRPWPDTTKILEYVDLIHMPAAIYVPGYVIGLVHGLCLYKGLRIPLKNLWLNLFLMTVAFNLPSVTGFLNGLYNEFGILPQSLAPLLIVTNRLLNVIPSAIFLTFYMSIWHPFNETTGQSQDRENTGDNQKDGKEFSPLTALCRLSYAVYLSNYYVVKTEFFTSRSLLRLGYYGVSQRLLMSMGSMMVMAVAFHLTVVTPFDNLRRKLMSPKQAKQKAL